MGGVPPMGFAGVHLPIYFCFCSGEGVLSSDFLFLLRNRLFGASGEPFFIFFAPKPGFEAKNIYFCFGNHVF